MRHTTALLALLICALTLLPLNACHRLGRNQPPTVVVYFSVDDHIARPILDNFAQQANLRVLTVGDTEATKTTGLVQRLIAEKNRPACDVFWSSEVFMTVKLADLGILASLDQPFVADWPAQFADPDKQWYAFAQRARVLAFNTDAIAPADAPRNMHDLATPQWAPRLVIARPQFGTTRGHMGALLTLWGETTYRQWVRDLKNNGARLVDGNATAVRIIATGEADICLTDTDDVWAGQANDWPIDCIAIGHDTSTNAPQGQSVVIPNTVALINGAPNHDNAIKLIEYLLSVETERALAESRSGNIPIRDEARPDTFPDLVIPPPIEPTYADIAANTDRAIAIFEEEFGR